MQKQCSKIGFDWDDVEPVLTKVEEELQEVRNEINQTSRDQEKIEEEIDFAKKIYNLLTI